MSKKNLTLLIRAVSIVGIVLAVIIVSMTIFTGKKKDVTENKSYNYSSDWQLESKGENRLINLPYKLEEDNSGEFVTISKVIEKMPYERPVVLFRTSQQEIYVYLDEKLIYERSHKNSVTLGKSVGSIYNFIELPKGYENKTLRIKIKSPYDDTSKIINDIRIGDTYEHYWTIIGRGFFTEVVSLVLFLTAIGVFVALNVSDKKNRKSIGCIVAFITCLSVWTFCDSDLIEIVFNNVLITYVLSTIALYCAPLFLFAYLYYSFDLKYKNSYRNIAIIKIILITLAMLGQLLNILDFYEVIRYYLYILIGEVVLCIVLVYRERSNNKVIKVLTIILYTITVCIIIDGVLINRGYISQAFLSETAVMVTLFIILLGMVRQGVKDRNLANAAQLKEAEMQTQIAHYEALESQQKELRKFRHDIRNHFLVLRSLLADKKYEEMNEYLAEIQTSVTNNPDLFNTGNKILDTLLSEKITMAKHRSIRVKSEVLVKPTIQVDNSDWVGLMGNIMDNAIEACERCVGNKSIDISLRSRGEMLIGIIKNSCDPKTIRREGDDFLTSKSDSRNHGIGVSTIKKRIDKYNGTCNIEIKDNTFILSFVLYNV